MVNEHYGSLQDLIEGAKGAANFKSHLQYKRPPTHSSRSDYPDVKKRKLPIGKDAGEKSLISRYAGRLEASMKASYTSRDRSIDPDDAVPDYSKLPDFDQ